MNHIPQAFFLLIVLSICRSTCLGQKSRRATPTGPSSLVESDSKAWREFSSNEGRFSVLMPGKPSEVSQTIASPRGDVFMRSLYLRTLAEYQVSYSDYPWEIEGSDGTAAFLDKVRDAGVEGMHGQLLEEKEILFEGHPGRAYKVRFGGGYIITTKMFVVKNRLYMVIATVWGNNAPNQEIGRQQEAAAARFLESFKLLPVKVIAWRGCDCHRTAI